MPPRPTLGDIDLPPRRRLRDGSRSSSSSSRSSSIAPHPRLARGQRGGRGRGRSASTLSTLSTATSGLSSAPSVPPRTGLRSGDAFLVNSGSSSSSNSNIISMDTDAPELNHESTNAAMDDDTTFSSSNVDTMPHTDPHTQGQRRRGIDHGSTLIDMLDALDRPDDASGSSISSQAHPLHPNTGRRYTAAEKGKGRAPANAATGGRAISISDTDDEGGDESIEVTGVKRKADVLEQSVCDDEEEDIEVIANEEEGWLGAYKPTNAVVTVCGHILCSDCLFSSLLASIGRNPNPQPPIRPKPKPKSRKSKHPKREPQPIEWTAPQLQEAWLYHRQKAYEEEARAAGMDEDSILAGRDDGEEVGVQCMLKGLWKVEGRYWVVEGECPVCRMGLPGGYGPLGKGIGGVIPLASKINSR